MLKIRLMRIGAKKRPFYRVVVIDERSKRSGEYLELLGTYNPLTKPHEIKLKQDRIDHWIKQGAQMSDGYLRIIGKAPQRPARKPKKEKKAEAPTATPAPIKSTLEEKPEQQISETPAESETIPDMAETPVEQLVTEETPSSVEESNPDTVENPESAETPEDEEPAAEEKPTPEEK